MRQSFLNMGNSSTSHSALPGSDMGGQVSEWVKWRNVNRPISLLHRLPRSPTPDHGGVGKPNPAHVNANMSSSVEAVVDYVMTVGNGEV